MPRRLETNYSTLSWSADERFVTKVRPPGPDARKRFSNELRVNRMLLARRPPVTTARLVGRSVPDRSLTFGALPGKPLGPKYPDELSPGDIDSIAGIAHRLTEYQPRRRWFTRFDSVRRLQQAASVGLLDPPTCARLQALAARVHAKRRFAHGDITARNVLDIGDGHALIDWEWAGLYPDGYDLAFLWFSLIDVASGRSQVEQHVDVDERAFLLCALLIELWHLRWYIPAEFRAPHLVTRDHLIDRLTG